MHGHVEKTYQKVSQIEHVLMRPEVYIGSIQQTKETMWVVDDEEMVQRDIIYVPGLYKIFDQILVNAADNYQRDRKMNKIEVNIKRQEITITNDGQPIPVQLHKKHSVYVPELIFGHLLTSSNYHDAEKKVTGGRNGFGAKLTNLFSTYFSVQAADSTNGKLFTLEWSNNMSQKGQPVIQPYSGPDYTRVTFRPDFSRFGLTRFSPDMISLMKRRVYDIAGILKVKVYLNGKLVPISSFKQYAGLYLREEEEVASEGGARNGRWQVLACKSEGQFVQISFVNSIATTRGGTHLSYIVDQITEKIIAHIAKKKGPTVKPVQVKAHLRIFINCLIENPIFTSQTKECLSTPVRQFGSTCLISDEFIKALLKSGIVESILKDAKTKEFNKIDRELKKVKKNRLIIPKLEDANEAGRDSKCCLILTEGDSAKALALCGLEELGRDFFGVFPLKGKPANVKSMTPKQVMDNNELSNIVKILGLTFGKEYASVKELRYGSVMIMADQDNDGSHIKALVINFFETFWPSLCRIQGFLKQFITPIIKASKGGNSLSFYSQVEFSKWREENPSGWTIKYYKGLGTSTSRQAKEYFTNLPKHQIQFTYGTQQDQQCLELAFDKNKSDLRKEWLRGYDPSIDIDHRIKKVTIEDFINKQLIHFSISDNVRSIPSVIDGLKPSQRKVLYACFKRNLVNQMKVAQLAGYVAEHSAYHHGEMSLCNTIVGMAQDFPGSNNLNLLLPLGQFGTRYENGKDSASSRYIFTKLNPMTRYLFKEEDDHLLDYQQEENQSIQPINYLPILPLVLINGAEGIGTGWSTSVLPHKVQDVIELVRGRIEGRQVDMRIGWQNFQGQVQKSGPGSFLVKGMIEMQGEEVMIREIPINKSIRDYKSFLEEKLQSATNQDPELQEVREYHQNNCIQFVLKFVSDKQPHDEDLIKYLKLSSTHQLNNMHLFNAQRKITKYESVNHILEEFYQQRLEGYTRRKAYLLSKFKREHHILENQVKFIRVILEGTFKLIQSKQDWLNKLQKSGFTPFQQLHKVLSTKNQNEEDSGATSDYNYLLTMPIWSFCQQKLNELSSIEEELLTIITHYRRMTEHQMWLKDIEEFENAWFLQQEGKQIQKQTKSRNQILAHKNQSKTRVRTSKSDSPHEEERQVRSTSIKARTMMEEEVEKQSRRKRIKKEEVIQIEESEPLPLQVTAKKVEKESTGIDSILSKYLVEGEKKGNELTLLDRIKARISGGDQTFNTSYAQAKQEFSNRKAQKKGMEEEKEDDEEMKKYLL